MIAPVLDLLPEPEPMGGLGLPPVYSLFLRSDVATTVITHAFRVDSRTLVALRNTPAPMLSTRAE